MAARDAATVDFRSTVTLTVEWAIAKMRAEEFEER
jgi:hypothetical protein